ncbi:MAG: glycosyltransferase [Bacteroidales bacterium]|nr:glycosyltransferase [Bacteroidales bacterium]MCF8333945.1 glycosyltransferase [Bacteroidales bacterium]
MRLFVLLPRVPYPIEKGDKLRAFHQLQMLAENHEVILCALSEDKIHVDAYTQLIDIVDKVHFIPFSRFESTYNVIRALISGKPMQVGFYTHSKARQRVDELIERYRPDHIYAQLLRVAEYVKDKPISKTLDYQDAFSSNIKRRAQQEFFLWKPLFYHEARLLKRYERKIFDYFDNKTIISIPDRKLIDHPDKEEIEIVPNGVDTSYFYPRSEEKTYDLLFTGNMNYPPNIHGAEFLVNSVLPLVREKYPEIRLLLSGANPHSRVKALAGNQVTVSGWVDDIRNSYASARIFIAPMQIGTGLQNKLLEAMAMKLPCITSRLANSSLNAEEEEEILIGNSPREYADHILGLLEDEEKCTALAENGHRFVLDNYDWYQATKKLERLMMG